MAEVKDRYTLELLDKILAPLKRIEAQAEKVGGVMERLEKMCSSGLGMAKLAAVIGGAVVGFGVLGSAISGVLGLMGRVSSAFGQGVISAATFREKYLGMFSHQFGEKAGKKLYDNVLDFAQLTPGTAAGLAETTGRFANIGIEGKNLGAAVSASADVQAMFGEEAGAKFGRGISDMWSKQHLELQDFKQSLSGIVGFDVAQAAILRLKGINVSAEKVGETFDKLHKKGKITGREGAIGSFMAVQEKIDKGGALGSYAVKRGAGSLEGLISNIGEAWDNLLRKADFENMPGIVALKDFLKRLLVFFDAATPQGKKLLVVVEKLTNTLFGGLKNIREEDLARFFESGLVVAERLVKTIEKAWEIVKQMMDGNFTGLAKAITGTMLEVGKLIGTGIIESLKALIPSLPWPKGTVFADAASKVVNGVAAGGKMVGGVLGTMVDGGAGPAAGRGWQSVVNDKQANPPQDRGQDPPWGALDRALGIPAMADGGIVTRPTLALIGEAGPEAVVPLSGGGGDQGAAAGADFVDAFFAGVRERAAELRDGLTDDLLGILRASATRSGAAGT